MHAGIRAPLVRPKGDLRNDVRCGFDIVSAREVDTAGIPAIVEKIKNRVAGTKVYISVDIDVLDPAFAPGTLTGPLRLFSLCMLIMVRNSHGYP